MDSINSHLLIKIFERMDSIFIENRQYLIELDSQMGDGDLGIYMAAGMTKALERISIMLESSVGEILKKVGNTYALEAPSTMGTLIASAFISAGKSFEGKNELDRNDFVGLYERFCEGIEHRGGAKLGDKTILDSLIPASISAKKSMEKGKNISTIAKNAYIEAKKGVEIAKNLRAKFGRPSYFGDATIGKYDGGSIVGMLICQAISEAISNR